VPALASASIPATPTAAANPVAFAPGLLGTHVRRRASQTAALAEVFIFQGEPKIRHAGFA
jgi:hypothetical protein